MYRLGSMKDVPWVVVNNRLLAGKGSSRYSRGHIGKALGKASWKTVGNH
jgi:hypothetical protein